MTSLDDAVKKIVAHIADTGKPTTEAIAYLWNELAFDQEQVERWAKRYLDGSFMYSWGSEEEDFACVWLAVDKELSEYDEPEGSSPGERTGRGCEVLTREEIEKAIKAMTPLFGKPKRHTPEEAPGSRFAWVAESDEQALQMLTVLSKLGVAGYRGQRNHTSVRIYGEFSDRKKISRVTKVLDRV
jgi:hypothetical protein